MIISLYVYILGIYYVAEIETQNEISPRANDRMLLILEKEKNILSNTVQGKQTCVLEENRRG